MVGTGKLLAAGHVTSYGLAYISGRLPVSPPLGRRFLEKYEQEQEQIEPNCNIQRILRCTVAHSTTFGRISYDASYIYVNTGAY